MKNKILPLTIGISTLLLGSAFYLLKSSNIIAFDYFYKLPVIGNLFFKLRLFIISLTIINNKIFTNNIFYNYLSDGLWALSLQMIILYIWDFNHNLIISIFILLIAITYEVFQYIKIIPGTSDIYDVIVYCLFTLIGILIVKNKLRIN